MSEFENRARINRGGGFSNGETIEFYDGHTLEEVKERAGDVGAASFEFRKAQDLGKRNSAYGYRSHYFVFNPNAQVFVRTSRDKLLWGKTGIETYDGYRNSQING